jgi:alkylation response protein AidB-like acyl-CoA dehydrogenase
MLVPEGFGGGSLTPQPLVDLMIVAEEFGRVLHPGPFVPTNVVADAIVYAGTPGQKSKYLPTIANGETTAAWCLSDDGRPEGVGHGVTARRTDSGYILDGRATFVQGATTAALILVHATGPDGTITAAIDSSLAGVSSTTSQVLDLTRRYGTVRFDGVNAGFDDVLLAEGESHVDTISRALDLANVLKAGEMLGAADAVFAMTLEYIKNRKQFGRAIGSFQAIKHRMANLLVLLEGMRAGTHYAALAFGEQFPDASLAVSTAASYNGDAFAFLTGECVQLHGGIGFAWEHDVHLYLRRAKVDLMLYGDPTWHRERLWTVSSDLKENEVYS